MHIDFAFEELFLRSVEDFTGQPIDGSARIEFSRDGTWKLGKAPDGSYAIRCELTRHVRNAAGEFVRTERKLVPADKCDADRVAMVLLNDPKWKKAIKLAVADALKDQDLEDPAFARGYALSVEL